MLSFPVVYVVALVTMVGMLISKEAKRIVWSREIGGAHQSRTPAGKRSAASAPMEGGAASTAPRAAS